MKSWFTHMNAKAQAAKTNSASRLRKTQVSLRSAPKSSFGACADKDLGGFSE